MPYQLNHCVFEGQYYGIGLFMKEDYKGTTLANIISEREGTNCEMRWSHATTEKHDSVYTCDWSQSSTTDGWYWKRCLLQRTPPSTHPQVAHGGSYTARFAIYGRIMFVNHDPLGLFRFNNFRPKTPSSNQTRTTAMINLGAYEVDRDLLPGDQIFLQNGKG